MSAALALDSGLPLEFARLLIDWQRLHGRSGLPWQNTRDPYRVWVSEIMLQQTQVSTVLSYFPRFLERFPTVQALAQASADEVMALWAGLGYYSRARNLHRCAQAVVAEHGGVFPNNASALQTLPGIGASTAAAIAAFCHGERVSIVDGNVRRVLSRLLAFDGDLALTVAQRQLWNLAQALLPVEPLHDDMTAYTQGLMDLGATLCLRSRPQCARCPVQTICRAHADNTVSKYPVKTRAVKRRHESWWLLLLRESTGAGGSRIWLMQRPAPGIWAGLYCPPVFDSETALINALPAHWRDRLRELEPVAHSLTHRELRLHPRLLVLDTAGSGSTGLDGVWIGTEALHSLGLPAPMRVLLEPWLQSPTP